MKSILKYLLPGKKSVAPKKVLASFKMMFGSSINIEWEKVQNEFEAIYYFEGIEQIARFNGNGDLLSLKRNLTIHTVPAEIAAIAKTYGEIMNVIEMKLGDTLNFEIIYRNESLIRFSLLLDENGKVLSHNTL